MASFDSYVNLYGTIPLSPFTYLSHLLPPHVLPSNRASNVAVSIQSGELVAEFEKPEPVWPIKPGAGGGDDSVATAEGTTPFVISRKWVAEFKAYHDQVKKTFDSFKVA